MGGCWPGGAVQRALPEAGSGRARLSGGSDGFTAAPLLAAAPLPATHACTHLAHLGRSHTRLRCRATPLRPASTQSPLKTGSFQQAAGERGRPPEAEGWHGWVAGCAAPVCTLACSPALCCAALRQDACMPSSLERCAGPAASSRPARPAPCRVLRWAVPLGAAAFERAPLRVDSGVAQGDLVGAGVLLLRGCLPSASGRGGGAPVSAVSSSLDQHTRSLSLSRWALQVGVDYATHSTRSLALLMLLLQVGVNYDPMIAKVVVHGPDRPAALASLHAALGALQVRCVVCRTGSAAAVAHPPMRGRLHAAGCCSSASTQTLTTFPKHEIGGGPAHQFGVHATHLRERSLPAGAAPLMPAAPHGFLAVPSPAVASLRAARSPRLPAPPSIPAVQDGASLPCGSSHLKRQQPLHHSI